MIVRRIKEEEYQRGGQLFGISFEFPVSFDQSNAEQIERMKTAPKHRQEVYYWERWGAFEDDDRTMMGFLVTMPMEVEFDGHTVGMTGIGGVSTLPHYRRRGSIREIMRKSLRTHYEEGYVLSYLFPFSTAYYRQFGYEICGETIRYTLNLNAIPRCRSNGRVSLVEQGSDYEAIKQVYREFVKGYNLAAKREDYDFNWVKEADPAKDAQYTYVYYNEAGEPKAYMTFSKTLLGDPPVKADGRYLMDCRQFVYADAEGFRGLCEHIHAFDGYYERVAFTLPASKKITPYIAEWARYPLRKELFNQGMVRIINVKRALELAKYRGSGELRIQVSDPLIQENAHIFRIRFEDGRAMEVGVDDGAAPDLSLPVAELSRLLLGNCEAEELPEMENVQISCDLEKLASIFYKKPSFVTEAF